VSSFFYNQLSPSVKSPTREYSWALGEIYNSLVDQGLKVEFIHEFEFLHWKGLESMEKCSDGFWRLPEPLNRIPLLFSIKALNGTA